MHAAARRTGATHPSRMTVVVPVLSVQNRAALFKTLPRDAHLSQSCITLVRVKFVRWMLVPRTVGGSYAITPVQ